MLTQDQAVASIQALGTGSRITKSDVTALLNKVHGVTFAGITTVTKVGLAAAHTAVTIHKVTVSSVQLFNNVTADVYAKAVNRSATRSAVTTEYVASRPHFVHSPECYGVVHNTSLACDYLYAIYTHSRSVYVMDGKLVNKDGVAALCTPSAARIMLNVPTASVVVRTPKLSSIVRLCAMGHTLLVV